MSQSTAVLAATSTALASPPRPAPAPFTLRACLVTAALVFGALGYVITSGEPAARAVAEAGAELTRLLRAMTLLKCVLGAGALGLVGLRFRFPVAAPLATAYMAAGAVMASGAGVMWNMAHIGLGALLLHGGLASLFALAWFDGGTKWRLGLRAAS